MWLFWNLWIRYGGKKADLRRPAARGSGPAIPCWMSWAPHILKASAKTIRPISLTYETYTCTYISRIWLRFTWWENTCFCNKSNGSKSETTLIFIRFKVAYSLHICDWYTWNCTFLVLAPPWGIMFLYLSDWLNLVSASKNTFLFPSLCCVSYFHYVFIFTCSCVKHFEALKWYINKALLTYTSSVHCALRFNGMMSAYSINNKYFI